MPVESEPAEAEINVPYVYPNNKREINTHDFGSHHTASSRSAIELPGQGKYTDNQIGEPLSFYSRVEIETVASRVD